ncbi:MAG TPA: DUF2878 domain-containing protein [Caldimonas sp.]|nr:DUF2878 domain-containing protein [Caldimonas sp.]
MTREVQDPIAAGARAPRAAASGPSRAAVVANFVVFQIAWFAAVLGAAHRWPALGTACVAAAVALHVASARRPREELAFVVAVFAGGLLVESLVVAQGHIVYPSGQPVAWLAPYWIAALWALLATAPNVTLRWLKGRPLLAALLGAICGPASFLAGVRLGGASFVDPAAALVMLALTWAVLMPALMALSTRLDGYALVPPRS